MQRMLVENPPALIQTRRVPFWLVFGELVGNQPCKSISRGKIATQVFLSKPALTGKIIFLPGFINLRSMGHEIVHRVCVTFLQQTHQNNIVVLQQSHSMFYDSDLQNRSVGRKTGVTCPVT
jgi:hypothetical protein